MKLAKATLPFIVFLASGCSSVNDVEPAQLRFSEDSFSNDSISSSLSQLSDAALMAAQSQKALAELANGMASTQMTREQYNEYVFQKDYVPLGMERSVGDIEWSGEAMPLLRLVAEMAGYAVAEPAHKPIFEPTVRIDTTSTGTQYNVADVIRAIEASNKEEIDIVIMEDSKIININYIY
ncbi:DotD/TraH family lipoprotein [Vibrio coralliirubri]|uniref:DotD/TraH family lipoprotein n=1 Tax=Vibrio coralliirubri TaxID=1516159 RepID=UPI002283C1C1|nr:DotD/TraH family lipoprotein [Vibrio coralliirubri]MCY9866130.1 DotD/TraH family lipoprotein [Vibrio coralliirubri]